MLPRSGQHLRPGKSSFCAHLFQNARLNEAESAFHWTFTINSRRVHSEVIHHHLMHVEIYNRLRELLSEKLIQPSQRLCGLRMSASLQKTMMGLVSRSTPHTPDVVQYGSLPQVQQTAVAHTSLHFNFKEEQHQVDNPGTAIQRILTNTIVWEGEESQ